MGTVVREGLSQLVPTVERRDKKSVLVSPTRTVERGSAASPDCAKVRNTFSKRGENLAKLM